MLKKGLFYQDNNKPTNLKNEKIQRNYSDTIHITANVIVQRQSSPVKLLVRTRMMLALPVNQQDY
jgi:hypothetical protein